MGTYIHHPQLLERCSMFSLSGIQGRLSGVYRTYLHPDNHHITPELIKMTQFSPTYVYPPCLPRIPECSGPGLQSPGHCQQSLHDTHTDNISQSRDTRVTVSRVSQYQVNIELRLNTKFSGPTHIIVSCFMSILRLPQSCK